MFQYDISKLRQSLCYKYIPNLIPVEFKNNLLLLSNKIYHSRELQRVTKFHHSMISYKRYMASQLTTQRNLFKIYKV